MSNEVQPAIFKQEVADCYDKQLMANLIEKVIKPAQAKMIETRLKD